MLDLAKLSHAARHTINDDLTNRPLFQAYCLDCQQSTGFKSTPKLEDAINEAADYALDPESKHFGHHFIVGVQLS